MSGLACPSGTEPVSTTPVGLSVVTPPAATGSSGVTLTAQPVVQLLDGKGAAVARAGRTVVASLATPGGTLGGTLSVKTNAEGKASFSDLVITGLAGPWTLRFDSPGLQAATATPVQLTAGAPALLTALAGGNLQTGVAGAPIGTPPSVRVTDAAGNPVSGVIVTFSASADGIVLGPAATTNADGIAAPTGWTLATAIGLNTLTATSSAVPGSSVSFTATGTAGPPAFLTITAGEGQNAAVGGSPAISPAVKLTDQAGHPLSSVLVSFAVGSGGGTVTPASVLTDANGIATVVVWTLGLPPGPNTLTVSRAGVPSVTVHATGVDFPVATIAAGNGHSCATDPAGAAFCWGANATGQIGNGAAANVKVPTAVGGSLVFTKLSAGNGHSCGIVTAGDAYCWGANDAGQLGDGSFVPHSAPTLLQGGHKFTLIAAGSGFTCGLLIDKTAWCWGFGGFGQLGDNTAISRSIPTLVFGSHLYTYLSAGTSHACAVEVSGTLYCWGSNGNGRLGDGTTVSKAAPTAIGGLLTFASVSAGGSHTCAITTGSVGYCWGNGATGLLGNDAVTDQLNPVLISGSLSLSSISANTSHSCALTTAATLFCWGFNGSGELGDGSFTNRLAPVAVAGGLTYSAVQAGAEHSCARATSGGVYCWGRNDTGAVGDGTLIPRFKPVGVVKQ